MKHSSSPAPDRLKRVLGKPPQRWKIERLKYAIRGVEQGWSPQCHAIEAGPDEWGVLKVGCVNGAEFDEHENKALPEELAPLPELEIKPDDILMSRANTRELLGSAVLVRSCRSKLMLCDKLFRIRVDRQSFDPRFLVYSFASAPCRFQFEGDATGTSGSMKNIGQDTLRNLWIAIPPLDEQRAIAAFLDRKTVRVDELIAKKKRLLELLTEKRRTLVDGAVTQGLRDCPSLESSGVSWLGTVPPHWKVRSFRYSMKVANGQVDPEDPKYSDLPLIAPNHIESGTGRLLNFGTAAEQAAESGKYYFEPGVVLYSKIRPALAKVCIAPVRGLCSADMYPITPRSDLRPRFLRYFMLSSQFTAAVVLLSSRVAMPKMNRRDLGGFAVPIPPLDEQDEIVSYLESQHAVLDNSRTSIEAAIEQLCEYRSALISAAVTGQIDVRQEAR